jgi:hypothetical protein
MPKPMGKHVGVIWTIKIHPDDSKELEEVLALLGFGATNEGLTDFIFDTLDDMKKAGKKSERGSTFINKLAEVMQDPAKAAVIEKTLRGIFTNFRR